MATYNFKDSVNKIFGRKTADENKAREEITIRVAELGVIMMGLAQEQKYNTRMIKLFNPYEKVIVKSGDKVILTDGYNYVEGVIDNRLFFVMKDFGRPFAR